MTSVKRRLDHLINELSAMGTEPDDKASENVAAQLSVIKAAFKPSERFPMCCFKYDPQFRVVCDVTGPLALDQFMEKCRQCQAHINDLLVNLNTD